MKEKFERVLDLQHDYDPRPTEAMTERGDLIRNAIPEEMRDWRAAQIRAAAPFNGRLNVQGRDGTGLKTFVPWVRIHSPELSPSAQNGWYVVYLFRADGQGVYLCLSHGSTFFDGYTFVPRPIEEMGPLMEWARDLLGPEAAEYGFGLDLDLAVVAGVALAYPDTTAFAKYYPREAIPADAELEADAIAAVAMLGRIYKASEDGVVPGMAGGEAREAERAIEEIARPNSELAKGQGFGLTHAQRCAVDAHAMSLAHEWLRAHGFSAIEDTSKASPFDFAAKLKGTKHIIEVKGTTGAPASVILTKNEVAVQREAYPSNLLIVVHGISLNRADTTAAGGELLVIRPWEIDQQVLTPLSFAYAIPS